MTFFLNATFLIDCLTLIAHGTFIGSIRIEANKPTQLPIDSTFHFGASTRQYILREKPSQNTRTRTDSDQNIEDSENNLNLPESEIELDVSPHKYLFFSTYWTDTFRFLT